MNHVVGAYALISGILFVLIQSDVLLLLVVIDIYV